MIPLSLYIHIPWCIRKCPYCDFNSHEADTIPEDAYVDALLADLAGHQEESRERPIQSIFIGGGTPSLFSPDAISRLLAGVRAIVTVADDAEVTLEANPGTVQEKTKSGSRFAGFKAAGINRISLGVQSFNPRHLTALGRIHTAQEASLAFAGLRQAGISNVNLDLMHGLPGQDVAGAIADLETAIALGPEHISWYQLTIEPNTVFHKRPPQLPDEDTLWDIYEAGVKLLAAHGYQRYEVSAFAREGQRSRHNINYWEFGDYIGIGAGAYGKLTNGDGISRTRKSRLPKDYLAERRTIRHPVVPSELPLEFMMNALRLVNGFELELFETRTMLPRAKVEPFLADAVQRGLLTMADDHVKPTTRGINHLNDMLVRIEDPDAIVRS